MLTHWLPITSILLRIVRICCWPFKRNHLKKENLFLSFLFHWLNLHHILKIFNIEKMVIANVFPKLQNVKDLVRQHSKNCRFKTSFTSQHVKGSQTLEKSPWEHFYQIFAALWGEMIWKLAALLKLKIIGVFFNILTADDKYPLLDCENLRFPILMRLY